MLYKKPFLFMNFIITFFLQMMNKEFGGSVHKKDTREDGQFTITVDPSVSLYRWESVHSCFPFLYTLQYLEKIHAGTKKQLQHTLPYVQ